MTHEEEKQIDWLLKELNYGIKKNTWIGLDFKTVAGFISSAKTKHHLNHKITRERVKIKNERNPEEHTVMGMEAYTELNKYVKVKDIKDLNYSKFFKSMVANKIKEDLNSNIQQYCNHKFTGKIIKATSIDKNGAYLSWFKEPLPYKLHKRIPFEYGIRLKEDEVAFYITEDLEGCSWERPDMPIKELLIFKTKVLEGSDKLLNEYKKSFTKEYAIKSIGYLSRHSLISSYIWFKQGMLISKVKNLLESKGIEVYKIHTDSITFEPKGYKYVKNYVDDGTFKLEYQDKNIFICHQSAYHVEGEFPKGLKPEDMIDGKFKWDDGTETTPDIFPCLKKDIKVSVIMEDRDTLILTRQWKTLLEIGMENDREGKYGN